MRERFEQQMEILHTELIELGALCEQAIGRTYEVLLEGNQRAAEEIIKKDQVVDAKEREIEDLCFRIILQQQPVARDLRQVSAALKMITDMERIGAQAADIADIVKVTSLGVPDASIRLKDMAKVTASMVTKCIDAYVKQDLKLAREVIDFDDIVDDLFDEVKDEILQGMRKGITTDVQSLDYLMIAKYYERIGDHATNIAEWVVYSINGRHKGELQMIYCVEDERNIRELIVYTLESSGITARGLESGKELNAAIAEQLPDLILLDIMLPGEDGLEILSRLKASEVTNEIPGIMVTAKCAEYDKVMGLDCGADDYITKPFGMMEFIARVRAVLRRAGKEEKENDVLETGDLQIQVKQHQVLAKGEKVTLTLKEFELLKFLMENKGIVLTRDRLLGHVWGYDFDGETRTVDVHVRTLRQKLGECGELIETVRGVGYRIGG